MNQQETIEFNRKCAEFLGFKCSINDQFELPNMMTFPPKGSSNLCHTAKVCCPEDMQFHSDWNWIMEVVEKIELLGFDVVLDTPHTFIRYSGTNTQTGLDNSIPKKERIVSSINEFLTWYSANK